MKIYQIGGSVRDRLMQRTPQDIDYVVIGSSLEEMSALGYKQVGKSFPVFINPQNGCEYALARKEIKTGPKHTDFKFIFDSSVTLAEDMERRDFTCNAIALDIETNEIIDNHNGIADIENKILRHINSNHFIEDPLRVLRLCRFAAQLDFIPAPKTLELATQMVKQGQLQHLTAERIWQEIFKALQSQNFSKFIAVAHDCLALDIILPEIKNTLSQTYSLLQNASQNTAHVKFAVLLHHITQPQEIEKICRRLKTPNNFRHFALLCMLNQAKLQNIHQMTPGELVDFADNFMGQNYHAIPDFISFCQIVLPKDETINLNDNISLFKKITQTMQNIKASDMPNFSSLPKDELFQKHYRDYKISILQKLKPC